MRLKPHIEFEIVSDVDGWITPDGYPDGIKQKILASDINENKKIGSRSRLLRFDPGVFTKKPFVHDHWEEVFLVSGDLIVGNDEYGNGGDSFTNVSGTDISGTGSGCGGGGGGSGYGCDTTGRSSSQGSCVRWSGH